jgi:hypothetical protein
MRRKLLAVLIGVPVIAALAVALVVMLGPGGAHAQTPTKQQVNIGITVDVPPAFSGCSFDVTLIQTGYAEQTTYYDNSGNVVKIFLRSEDVSATYYGLNGAYAFIKNSPASVTIDPVADTVTYNGLQANIVVPHEGEIGAATGHVTFNMATGATLVADGQTSFLTPWTPAVCGYLSGQPPA